MALNDAVLDPVSHLPLKIDCCSKTFTSKERRGGPVSEGGLQDHLSLHYSSSALPFWELAMLFSGAGKFSQGSERKSRVLRMGSSSLTKLNVSQTPASCLLLAASSFETKENQQNPLLYRGAGSINAIVTNRPCRAHTRGTDWALERAVGQGCKTSAAMPGSMKWQVFWDGRDLDFHQWDKLCQGIGSKGGGYLANQRK